MRATSTARQRSSSRRSLENRAGGRSGSLHDARRGRPGSGVREADPEFFLELRALCDEVGVCLIFDEVQTGVGRTGNWFFAGSELAGNVEPDVITLAKSLGSGIPVGACIISENISSKIKENDLGTTFGGGMIAMAATLATLEAIENDAMIENATMAELQLRDSISNSDGIAAVRGKGCLLGIEFEEACGPVHKTLLENKIITGTSSDPKVLRLLPPLCVTSDEISQFVQVLNG